MQETLYVLEVHGLFNTSILYYSAVNFLLPSELPIQQQGIAGTLAHALGPIRGYSFARFAKGSHSWNSQYR
jgi:hypothetical protein